MATAKRSLRAAFGQALQDLRRKAGISQEELAYRSGLHRTYVSQLERGLKSPSLDAIAALSEALEQQPHELIKAAEDLRR